MVIALGQSQRKSAVAAAAGGGGGSGSGGTNCGHSDPRGLHTIDLLRAKRGNNTFYYHYVYSANDLALFIIQNSKLLVGRYLI